MNKLEQISQMNWSKRDQKIEAIASGNQSFNRVSVTNDPQTYAVSRDVTVVDNPKLSILSPGRSEKLAKHQFTSVVSSSENESFLKGAKTSIRLSRTGGSHQRSPLVADLKTDYFKVASHLNADGRNHYVQAVLAKTEKTNTVMIGSTAEAKMQKKAYRSNQPSMTSYVEKIREQQNLLNF